MAKPALIQFPASAPHEETASSADIPDGNVGAVVGANVRRLRGRRGLSLDNLAKVSGVSRSMLSQIETGRSVPSINVVFKIARAFGVPFSALLAGAPARRDYVMPAGKAKTLRSASAEFSTRALFPLCAGRKTEFYELRLSAGGAEEADAHAPGTMENLIVVRGKLEITTAGGQYLLLAGDAFFFQADEPHTYRNLANEEALIYLVMTYQEGASDR
jgi:transcriptional regulator with XRE-family HTH domain